jgi:hypothetical protein
VSSSATLEIKTRVRDQGNTWKTIKEFTPTSTSNIIANIKSEWDKNEAKSNVTSFLSFLHKEFSTFFCEMIPFSQPFVVDQVGNINRMSSINGNDKILPSLKPSKLAKSTKSGNEIETKEMRNRIQG